MAAPIKYVVRKEDLFTFCQSCMEAVGAPHDHAVMTAGVITEADYRGHFSHGLNRLRFYMHSYQFLNKDKDQTPNIVKETPATALVDGNNLLGPAVGTFCMKLAIQKAKSAGIGWVSAYRSNHFGIAGHYSKMAIGEGLVGMAFCNATPVVVPTRAKQSVFGTNPISVAAPGNSDDSFVLDMATSTVAVGKVELRHRIGESMPDGWGLDENGKSTTDPSAVLKSRKLTPLGGLEESRGYKGYGLAMMVEMFSSVLSGSNSSPDVKHPNPQQETNLGQCFVALDPGVFAPGFADRMSELIGHCRGLQPEDEKREVMVAGDPENAHMTVCDDLGGIPYHENQIHFADDIAAEYHVQLLERRKC